MKFVVFTIALQLLKFSRDKIRLSISLYIPMHIVRVKIFKKLILTYISSGSQIFEIFPKMPL
jgi:hypothetical protein